MRKEKNISTLEKELAKAIAFSKETEAMFSNAFNCLRNIASSANIPPQLLFDGKWKEFARRLHDKFENAKNDRIIELEAQVTNWERKEIQKAEELQKKLDRIKETSR